LYIEWTAECSFDSREKYRKPKGRKIKIAIPSEWKRKKKFNLL
jgi:hypothetical protein